MPEFAPGPAREARKPSALASGTRAIDGNAPRSGQMPDGRLVTQRIRALQAAADDRGSAAVPGGLRGGSNLSAGRVGGRPVAQRAGTKPNVASADGRYRIKLSSDREEFTYTNAGVLGLQAILPGSHPVTAYVPDASGKVTSVTATVAGVATNINLASPIDPPGGGKRLLVIDTVGYEAPAHGVAPSQKLFLDVKIGTFTKSGEQFALEGAGWFMRQVKKIEHNIKDSGLDRGSRTTGYDVDKGNAAAFDTAYNQAMATPPGSAARLAFQAAMQEVVGQLATIQATILTSPVRFVGSSLFFVFNLTNPNNSEVRLIDPDHPIIDDIRNLATGAVPADVMTDQSSGKSRADWSTYFDKWENSFDTGVRNFVNDWFVPRKNGL